MEELTHTQRIALGEEFAKRMQHDQVLAPPLRELERRAILVTLANDGVALAAALQWFANDLSKEEATIKIATLVHEICEGKFAV